MPFPTSRAHIADRIRSEAPMLRGLFCTPSCSTTGTFLRRSSTILFGEQTTSAWNCNLDWVSTPQSDLWSRIFDSGSSSGSGKNSTFCIPTFSTGDICTNSELCKLSRSFRSRLSRARFAPGFYLLVW